MNKYINSKYSHLFDNKQIMPDHMPGWIELIDVACDMVQDVANIKITTIKEKYGELRIYYRGDIAPGDMDHVYNVIEFTSELSNITCIYCGEPAETKDIGGGELVTCCDKCFEHMREL